MANVQEYLTLKKELRFNKDRKFKILMMSDIHGGVGMSKQIPVAIKAVFDEVQPDLVLLAGDIAGPGVIHVSTQQELREMLEVITQPMESAGVPWAHVYGNHDDNFGLMNGQQQPVYESFPCCVSKWGDRDISGVGNYVLPILSHEGEKIVFNVFGLDSHRGMCQFSQEFGLPEDTQYVLPNHFCNGRNYDSVHFDQIMWYYNTSKLLEEYNGGKIPALMYMHIPIPEHCLITRNRDRCQYEGNQGENVACTELNPGVFSACVQRGDVKAIFCGHEHINDFSGVYCGIKLGYDAGMDYNAYQQDALRGARVFELNESDAANINTYIVRVRDIMGDAGDRIYD